MKPIPNWRKGWRMWSVRLNAVGSLLLGFLLFAPDAILSLWATIRPEAREALPAWLALGLPLVCFVGAIVARFIRQERCE